MQCDVCDVMYATDQLVYTVCTGYTSHRIHCIAYGSVNSIPTVCAKVKNHPGIIMRQTCGTYSFSLLGMDNKN